MITPGIQYVQDMRRELERLRAQQLAAQQGLANQQWIMSRQAGLSAASLNQSPGAVIPMQYGHGFKYAEPTRLSKWDKIVERAAEYAPKENPWVRWMRYGK